MAVPPIIIPDDVRAVLQAGAALVVSISGGKDSQALMNVLGAAHQAEGWPGPLRTLTRIWGGRNGRRRWSIASASSRPGASRSPSSRQTPPAAI